MAEPMENQLLNIVIMISVVWIVRRFWGSFYEKKQSSVLSISLWLAYAVFLFFFGYRNGHLQIFATVMNILFIFGVGATSYKSAGREKYFLVAVLCAGWCLAEVLVYSLLRGLPLAEGAKQDAAGLVLSGSLMAAAVYVLSVLAGKRKNVFASGKQDLFLLLIPVGSIAIAVNEFCSRSNSFSAIITVSILLLFNILVFEFYLKRNEISAYERERAVYALQSGLMEKTTVSQKKMLEEFYAEKHDLKNRLIVLKDCVEHGDTETVRRSLERMIQTGGSSERISNTGNSTVDALLNFKYAAVRDAGISFRLTIFIPQKLPVESCDLGIVLGNALDNAIEAVQNCGEQERWIEVSMGVKRGALVLLLKNPYAQERKMDRNGRYRSTKTDSRRHGYGLHSIARIAEKYQGTMTAEARDGMFSLTVILNLPEI